MAKLDSRLIAHAANLDQRWSEACEFLASLDRENAMNRHAGKNPEVERWPDRQSGSMPVLDSFRILQLV